MAGVTRLSVGLQVEIYVYAWSECCMCIVNESWCVCSLL